MEITVGMKLVYIGYNSEGWDEDFVHGDVYETFRDPYGSISVLDDVDELVTISGDHPLALARADVFAPID